jgi:hypothetical protein
MKKALPWTVLLLLGLVFTTGLGIAGDLGCAPSQAPQPTVKGPVCDARQQPEAPALAELLTPAPQPAGPCPRIGCVDGGFCKQDRDCTAAPGGVCNLFCPSMGCCSYPAP